MDSLRHDLFPVADRLELVLKISSERRIELLFRDKLREVGVESHLHYRKSSAYIYNLGHAHLISCYGIQKR